MSIIFLFIILLRNIANNICVADVSNKHCFVVHVGHACTLTYTLQHGYRQLTHDMGSVYVN